MCGIVGYIGEREPVNVLVSGLRKLEYRGYDSSGVAVVNAGHVQVVRAEGKLTALEEKLKNQKLSGTIGIGHTRWATHGIPSERNAHPHTVDGVCLVHNGIIENYIQLKAELSALGATFSSDTDSEVVAHLLAQELKKTPDIFKAIQKIIPRLEGAYAILAMWEKEPQRLVAFKNGPPLILGVGNGECVVGSDVQALLSYTDKVIYLDDGEVACIEKDKYVITDSLGKELNKAIVTVHWTSQAAEKHGFKHFMLKEIYEQPLAVSSVLKKYTDLKTYQVEFSSMFLSPAQNTVSRITEQDLKNVERIFIVACGTSYYSAMYAEYLIEKLAKIPVEVDFASEFRYRDPVIPPKSLVMVISQSGETADTLAVLRMAKNMGAPVLSLTNTLGSTIDREADLHLFMEAGVEIGVASTKAFISTLTVINLFSLYLARTRKYLSIDEEKQFVQNLLALPSHMESVLAHDKFFAEAAETFKNYKGFLYLGRGINYPIAMEGALKLKELAYKHAEGYAAGEMKHGPLALIDDKMMVIVINPQDNHYEKTLSNLQEAKARGGIIVSIGTGDDASLKSVSEHYLSIPKSDWMASGILSVIPVQLLAYHLADVLGYDVDQPRNLAKSVTVE
ncbi:MAG: glutamine--fructose-6-phosphate transaminase (isomerizing) [Bdellovibrionaceae bacterium]|nr:glutamine--fructose-6-phosphate transaminase (isomerizing) [Pseudobdellovibrionaceae bacterium]